MEIPRQSLVAVRKRLDVLRVKVDQVLCDLASFVLVGRQKLWDGQIPDDEVELPGEVEAVVNAGVGALGGQGGVAVAGLSSY